MIRRVTRIIRGRTGRTGAARAFQDRTRPGVTRKATQTRLGGWPTHPVRPTKGKPASPPMQKARPRSLACRTCLCPARPAGRWAAVGRRVVAAVRVGAVGCLCLAVTGFGTGPEMRPPHGLSGPPGRKAVPGVLWSRCLGLSLGAGSKRRLGGARVGLLLLLLLLFVVVVVVVVVCVCACVRACVRVRACVCVWRLLVEVAVDLVGAARRGEEDVGALEALLLPPASARPRPRGEARARVSSAFPR